MAIANHTPSQPRPHNKPIKEVFPRAQAAFAKSMGNIKDDLEGISQMLGDLMTGEVVHYNVKDYTLAREKVLGLIDTIERAFENALSEETRAKHSLPALPKTEREKIEEAIAWIKDDRGFTHIHDIPEMLREQIQLYIIRAAERHLEELASTNEITPDEVTHAHTLMQIAQGKQEWTKDLVTDTRLVLGEITEWAQETQLEDLQERLDNLTKPTDTLQPTASPWER